MPPNEEQLKQAIVVMEKNLGLKEGRELFVSYSIRTLPDGQHGFGNMVTKFYPELYQNNQARFLVDLEKAITMAVEAIHKTKCEVKVLFFR